MFYCNDDSPVGFVAQYDEQMLQCQCFLTFFKSIQSNQLGQDCAVINGQGVAGGS